MKSINLYSAIFLGILVAGFSSVVKSQTCGMSYPLTLGSAWTMTNYNEKGKIEGTSANQIIRSASSTEGTVASVQTISKDNKDTVLGTSYATVKCMGGKFYIDMQSLIPAQSAGQFKGMSIKSDASSLEIPQTLTVGLVLPDALGTMTIYNEGAVFATMKISITNRMVAAKESITTAAGTFDCYKITQDFKTDMIMMGMSVPTNMKTTEYYAAETGMIKSLTYDKNSKLVGYSELTSITKK